MARGTRKEAELWESLRATVYENKNFITARNRVSETYRGSGRDLAPNFVQIKISGGVH